MPLTGRQLRTPAPTGTQLLILLFSGASFPFWEYRKRPPWALIDTQAAQRSFASEKAAALADRERTLAALARTQELHRLVTSSRSWWLTAPLRRLMTLLLGLRTRIKRGQSGEPTKASGTQ